MLATILWRTRRAAKRSLAKYFRCRGASFTAALYFAIHSSSPLFTSLRFTSGMGISAWVACASFMPYTPLRAKMHDSEGTTPFGDGYGVRHQVIRLYLPASCRKIDIKSFCLNRTLPVSNIALRNE